MLIYIAHVVTFLWFVQLFLAVKWGAKYGLGWRDVNIVSQVITYLAAFWVLFWVFVGVNEPQKGNQPNDPETSQNDEGRT